MANSLNNFTLNIAKAWLNNFESKRMVSKMVNTQLLKSAFNPDSGEEVNFKRPIRHKAIRTPKGDLTAETPNDIVTGRAKGTVQDYITTYAEIDIADLNLKAGDDFYNVITDGMADESIVELENTFLDFMLANIGLSSGTPGAPVTTWKDVANSGAMMKASGIPSGAPWYYAFNPHTEAELADVQLSLGSGGVSGDLIKTAYEQGIVKRNLAGMQVMSSTSLPSFTTSSVATRTGTIASVDVTYDTAKNTMTQAIGVANFGNNLEVRIGETLRNDVVNRINLSTRRVFTDSTGSAVKFTGTVTKAVTLSGTGTGTITITGPAIYETSAGKGGYNTSDAAFQVGDALTLLGTASKLIQPNMFWHRDAFSIGFVPMKKLDATDTIMTTKDGMQFRVTRFSDGVANTNKLRIDFQPTFANLNPFWSGQGHGA